jgi:four helix bundle protein
MGAEKKYDLEDRALEFAKRIRRFVRNLQMDIPNREDAKQLVRSSGSIGANYIEANDRLSKKDFLFRIKLSRKEAKETKYWLNLIETFGVQDLEKERLELLQEANELMLILGAILRNSK